MRAASERFTSSGVQSTSTRARPVAALVTPFPALSALWVMPNSLTSSSGDNLIRMQTEDTTLSGPFTGESLLHMVVEEELVDVLGTDVMRTVVEWKWRSFGRRYFMRQVLRYVVFLLLFTVVMIVGSVEAPHCSSPRRASDWTGREWVGSWPIYGLLALSSLLMLAFESRKAANMGVARYLSDFWNVFEVLTHMLVVVLALVRTQCDVHVRHQNSLASVTAVLLWFNLLEYLRGFSSFGLLVRIIFAVLRQIYSFLVLMSILLFGFAVGFFCLFRGVSETAPEVAQRYEWWEALLTTYLMFFYEYNMRDFAVASNRTLGVLMQSAFLFLAIIVMLNLLIAVMWGVYEAVQANVMNESIMERARILVEIEQFLPMRQQTFRPNFPLHVHVLRAQDWVEENVVVREIGSVEQEKHAEARAASIKATFEERTVRVRELVEESTAALHQELKRTQDDVRRAQEDMRRAQDELRRVQDEMRKSQDEARRGVDAQLKLIVELVRGSGAVPGDVGR